MGGEGRGGEGGELICWVGFGWLEIGGINWVDVLIFLCF